MIRKLYKKSANTLNFKHSIYNDKAKAFTLAEALTVIVILGIIAALLVPALLKNYRYAIYRTKIKKAMVTYETAFNNMVMDSGIYRDTNLLNDWANTNKLRKSSLCFKSKTYFNILKSGYTDCVFRTADGIWWDISTISNPLISLKDEITLNNNDTLKNNAKSIDSDKTSYVMTGRLVSNGMTKSEIRLNDKDYEDSLDDNDDNKAYLTKLYNFLNK